MMTHAKPKTTGDTGYEEVVDEYAPKKYSLREQVAMGAKLALVIGFLLGLLWLLSTVSAK